MPERTNLTLKIQEKMTVEIQVALEIRVELADPVIAPVPAVEQMRGTMAVRMEIIQITSIAPARMAQPVV